MTSKAKKLNNVAGKVPKILRKQNEKIRDSAYFDDINFNTRFDALATQLIRVTIWESDGKVIYDNFNGRNSVELAANYYADPLNNNNHNTRLEAQLATELGCGTVIRGSSTLQNNRFYYRAKFVHDKDHNIRGTRLALQLL